MTNICDNPSEVAAGGTIDYSRGFSTKRGINIFSPPYQQFVTFPQRPAQQKSRMVSLSLFPSERAAVSSLYIHQRVTLYISTRKLHRDLVSFLGGGLEKLWLKRNQDFLLSFSDWSKCWT